jgi:hypothetical protein
VRDYELVVAGDEFRTHDHSRLGKTVLTTELLPLVCTSGALGPTIRKVTRP